MLIQGLVVLVVVVVEHFREYSTHLVDGEIYRMKNYVMPIKAIKWDLTPYPMQP